MGWRMLGGCVWGVRSTPFEGKHPHSFGKLRTGSNLPPSRGKGFLWAVLGEAGGGEAFEGDVGRSGRD